MTDQHTPRADALEAMRRTLGQERTPAYGDAIALCRSIERQNHNLRTGLQFYAEGHHFLKASEDAWDTVSGEPQNFWCDEAGTATVEDGAIAALALAGYPIVFEDEGQLTDRELFKKQHQHLDLEEAQDGWGRPVFKHSHVEAMWSGWQQAQASSPPDAGSFKQRLQAMAADRDYWKEQANNAQLCLTESVTQLFSYYGVTSVAQLIEAQAAHVKRLQAKLPHAPDAAPQRVREG